MSTTSEFDIAPLSWVNEEIRNALRQANELISHENIEAQDTAQLRSARTFLHQVMGALEMIDLRGVALVCLETENLLHAMEQSTVTITPENLVLITRTTHDIEHYLDNLLAGQPNHELSLFPIYRSLREARGVTHTVASDLFFPNLDFRSPYSQSIDEIPNEQRIQLFKQERSRFQRGLLAFLRQSAAETGLASMRQAVHTVEAAMSTPSTRTFWWGTTAFIDSLITHSIEPSFEVKQLCGRIDLQLRRHIEGSNKIAERLLRELLYFIAQSTDGTERISEVKKIFNLAELLPKSEETTRPTHDMRETIRKAINTVNLAKDAWGKFTAGNADSLNLFQVHADGLHDFSRQLNQDPINQLTNEILHVALDYAAISSARQETINLEIATALLWLQNTFDHIDSIDPISPQQCLTLTQRLQTAAWTLSDLPEFDNATPLLDAMSRRAQEKQLLHQLSQEIQQNVHKIEETLDVFFRDEQHDRHMLPSLNKPLTEIHGALSIMQWDLASQILDITTQKINNLCDATIPIDSTEFQLIAEAISAISLYVDAERYQQANTISLLQPALVSLGLIESNSNNSLHGERVEDELEQLKTELQHEAEAWRLGGQDDDAKKKLTELLQQVSQDAELIGDMKLKAQAQTALRLLNTTHEQAAILPAIADILGKPVINAHPDLSVYDMSENELLDIFLVEAREVLSHTATELAVLAQLPAQPAALQEIRRDYHTLKGSGRMVGLTELGETAWAIEQLLNQWLQEERLADNSLITLLQHAQHHFTQWIDALAAHHTLDADHGALATQAEQLRVSISAQEPVKNPQHDNHSEPSNAPQNLKITTDTQTVPSEIDVILMPVTSEQGEDLASLNPNASPDFPAQVELVPDGLGSTETQHVTTITESIAPLILSTNIDSVSNNAELEITIGNHVIPVALLDIFLREADTHLVTLEHQSALSTVEPGLPVSHDYMRAAHTLAGTARLTGFTAIADLSHALEALLTPLQHATLPIPLQHHALIQRTQQALNIMLTQAKQHLSPLPQATIIQELQDVQTALLADTLGNETHSPSSLQPVIAINTPLDTSEPLKIVDDSPLPIDNVDEIDTGDTLTPVADIEPYEPLTANLPPPTTDDTLTTDDLDEQLLPIFLEEASDLLPAIEHTLREWRNHPDSAIEQELQRHLHTLKGSARMAGAMRLGDLTHELETDIVRSAQTSQMGTEDYEQLENRVDQLTLIVEQLRHPTAFTQPASQKQSSTPAVSPAQITTMAPEGDSSAVTLRVRADIIDRLVNEASEINITRSRLENSTSQLRNSMLELTENAERLRTQLRELDIQAESQMQSTLSHLRNENSDFDPLEFDRFTRLQELTRMIAESVNDIQTVQQGMILGLNETDAAITQQGRLAKNLQQSLMHIRMLPLSSVSERLHRTVRLAAKDLGKKASLQITGGHVEFDRGVLEKITAPLEHLLRNSVAHGIESPAERTLANKSEYGEIVLNIRQENNEIIIALIDDGRGLNLPAIRQHGITQGLITSKDMLSDEALAQLIFASGFSTAETLTTLSGRGIGMDVVKSEINQLGGRIELHSEPGKGLHSTLFLPLTLAVTQAVMIHTADQTYAVPSVMIDHVIKCKQKEMREYLQTGVVIWQEHTYPLSYLPNLLDDSQLPPTLLTYNSILLLRNGQQRCAILVDRLTGNQEVVVKNIGPQLASVPGIAGATVLGNGQIVLILNPVQLYERQNVRRHRLTSDASPHTNDTLDLPAVGKRTVMVVDDSLTVRKITSRLLQREGYDVITAKDGVDALQWLQSSLPDVMLLDIEMPRMDGFELTKIVRADTRMSALPIIMITSRTANKHRDHAMNLGVNAYLGKPYQEDSLLHTIATLIQHEEAIILDHAT